MAPVSTHPDDPVPDVPDGAVPDGVLAPGSSVDGARGPGGARGDHHPSASRSRRSARRRAFVRVGAAVLVVVVFVFVVVRLRSSERDLVTAYRNLRWTQLPWLVAVLSAEAVSFVCYALVQRRLLRVGGVHLTRRTMVSLAVAATGVTNLVPGGTAPASGWLVGQYRRRDIPMPLALWAVLAGGYAATVSILTLLLGGAAVAGLVSLWVILGCGVVLVIGAGAVAFGAQRFPTLLRQLERVPGLGRARFLKRLSEASRRVVRFRTTVSGGIEVLALSLANWSLDVVVLIGSFGLLGLSVPWRAVLFAYATAQVAGSLAPLPGGIGFVEGGMIGAFALAGARVGDAVAATVVYRAVTCWIVAAVGSVLLVIISRRHPPPAALDAAGP